MRSSAIAPAGIGTAWLFCSHSTTFSSGRGAGRPAKRSDGQALASCVQDDDADADAVVGRVGVQRVFHHVMAGDADRVDEQLAGEGGSPKRSRTCRLSMENPPGPAGSACSQVARIAPSASNSRSHRRTFAAP